MPVRLAQETRNGGRRGEESLGVTENSVELGHPRASLGGRRAMADGGGSESKPTVNECSRLQLQNSDDQKSDPLVLF